MTADEIRRAAGTVEDPNGLAPNRYVYYPGTEELGKDEIRLIALGTGMPLARRSQAGAVAYVTKSHSPKSLLTAIEEARLQRKHGQRTHRDNRPLEGLPIPHNIPGPG